MSDLQDLLERFARTGQQRGAEAVFSSALVNVERRRRRRRLRGRFAAVIALAAVLLATAAVAVQSQHHQAVRIVTSPTSTPASLPSDAHGVPLTARVILSARTMRAGSSMPGRVVVENRTGHPVHAQSCSGIFAVVLTNDKIRQDPSAGFECLYNFTIPVGVSSYPLKVNAFYMTCNSPQSRSDLPACLPHQQMPPLPPGDYNAVFFSATQLFPTPPPIPVRVTVP